MPISTHNAQLRGRSIYVKLMDVLRAIFPAGPSPLRHLTDAQARDIGLDQTQMEHIRFEYPSRTTHHPRL